jgi:hypothetical protein
MKLTDITIDFNYLGGLIICDDCAKGLGVR